MEELDKLIEHWMPYATRTNGESGRQATEIVLRCLELQVRLIEAENEKSRRAKE